MLDVPHSYISMTSFISILFDMNETYPVIITLSVDAVHVYANATYIAINITHASVI